MIPCPSCQAQHRGPRDLELIHAEGLRVFARAAEMPMVDAAACLRIHLLALALELSGVCANCAVNAQASFTGSVSSDAIAAVREAEGAMQAAGGAPSPEQIEEGRIGPGHICRVIGLDSYRKRKKG